jgi:ribosomal-protein-alanine N-acetyltransferase
MKPGSHALLIESERVCLREFRLSDLDDSLAVVGDPRVTQYLSFDTKTREEQEALLSAQLERARQSPRLEYYLAAAETGSGRLVGFVRLGLGAHRSAKLGYAVRFDRWGRGYATEAAGALLRFGFSNLGLHRVTAACGPDNGASIRVLEKLGCTYEGRMRDHVFTNGAWRDSLLYSLLEKEYRARFDPENAPP